MISNPKLEDSNLVGCFPQGKSCPIGCNQCYASIPGCYAPMTQSNIPTPEEVGNRIVRMNDIGDSNVDRALVIETARQYKHVYFNTSINKLDFPGPVILTTNPKELEPDTWTRPGSIVPVNLMAVRVRLCPANAECIFNLAVRWIQRGVPVLFMHMRYYDIEALYEMLVRCRDGTHIEDYIATRHILNESWQPTPALKSRIEEERAVGSVHGLYVCGKYSLCKDCGLCEHFYWLARRRMNDAGMI